LTEAEAVAAMNRGVAIEEFLERADGQVRYLTAARRRDGLHVLVIHVVKDEGTDDFADISEFSPVDDEEYVGGGRVLLQVDDALAAVVGASSVRGDANVWVNQGMAAELYVSAREQASGS
jgi:hypothetical protein